jgi:HAMP domain-containing protein
MKKRRLVGPTAVSIILCALVADSLYFADAPWSAVRFIKKFLSGFGAIFAPAFDPVNYGWLDAVAVPVTAVAAGIVILVITVLRAKSAMRQATPAPDAPVFTPAAQARGDNKAEILALDPAEKPQRSYGFFGRLTFSFCAISTVFAISACAIIYSFLAPVMDQQIKARAGATTFGIGETVSWVRDGSDQNLSEVLRKYASMDGVAFVYIEDGEGKIIAHFPKDMPIYLDRDFPRSSDAALRGVTIRYRGAAVYETAKRIKAGNAGFVHLGLYSSAIEAESRRAFAPIGAFIAILLIASAAVFISVVRAVHRPLSDLARHADQISKGEFAVPLPLKRADEIGEIARSLERLRSSLRAVVNRLDQTEQVRQQSKG